MTVVEDPIAGTIAGPDADAGKLFDVPRVKVTLDRSDPNVIKVAFSGAVELDRDNATQVEFFNKLAAGEERELVVTAYVAGGKKVHRRDSEGYVDAVVETRSLVVTDVYFAHHDE